MMKLMCDCGCGHPIAEYDAGQMPVIVRRGSLLMEVRVMPGPTGARPNIRPFCTRTAVAEGEIVFPLSGLSVQDAEAVVVDRRVRSITARLDAPARLPENGAGAEDEREQAASKGAAPQPLASAATW